MAEDTSGPYTSGSSSQCLSLCSESATPLSGSSPGEEAVRLPALPDAAQGRGDGSQEPPDGRSQVLRGRDGVLQRHRRLYRHLQHELAHPGLHALCSAQAEGPQSFTQARCPHTETLFVLGRPSKFLSFPARYSLLNLQSPKCWTNKLLGIAYGSIFVPHAWLGKERLCVKSRNNLTDIHVLHLHNGQDNTLLTRADCPH